MIHIDVLALAHHQLGVFSLVAALMICKLVVHNGPGIPYLQRITGIMGITMLRMDRAKIKWRIKLQKAFNQDPNIAEAASQGVKQSKSGKYALFLLPMITVCRLAFLNKRRLTRFAGTSRRVGSGRLPGRRISWRASNFDTFGRGCRSILRSHSWFPIVQVVIASQ
jgi:hypothetical protein